jgi:hypothetical protein
VVDLGSIRSDEIVINEVVIDGPEVTLEFSGTKTNWGTLLEGLQKGAEQEQEQPESGAGKAVRIDRILFTNGKVHVAGIPALGTASVPLPKLEITHSAEEKAERRTVRQVALDTVTHLYAGIAGAAKGIVPAEQLKMLAGEAGELLKGAGAAVKDAAGLAAGAAGAAAKEAGELGGAAAGRAGEAAGKAAGAVGGAASSAGEAVGGAAETVGGAAKGAAGKASGLVKGVFGGGDDDGDDG